MPLYNKNDQVKWYWIEKIWEDEKLSNKPEVLLDGPGYSGYISGPRTTAQNIMQNLHRLNGPWVDPLEIAKKIHKQGLDKGNFIGINLKNDS